MKITPGNDYVFELGKGTLIVRWFWSNEDGVDNEQFSLSIREKTIRHGQPGMIELLVDALPIIDSYGETERCLSEAIERVKSKGWSVKERPFNTGLN